MADRFVRDWQVEAVYIAKSFLAELPVAPAVGDVHWITAGADINKICICVAVTPTWEKRLLAAADEGVTIYNVNDDKSYRWDGTALVEDPIGHARQHAITSAADHTSGATAGKILKADANGLPVDATNTDTDVADAVTKKHDSGTAGTYIAGVGIKFTN